MAAALHATTTAAGMTTYAGQLDAYFDEAAILFDKAVERTGHGHTRKLLIAGHSASLRFAGTALAAKVLPALEHLPEHHALVPELTVTLWDLKSSDTALPPPPWEALAFHERGNMRLYHDERFSLSFERRTDVFSAVDDRRRLAIYWTRDADALPNYTAAAPLHRLLQAWLQTKRLFVLHAAAIGRTDGGLLLAGRGGSGKSTTAVLSLRFEDLAYAGDDFALVEYEPAPYVHSLYSTAKLNVDALDRLPELRSAVSNAERLDREKALLFLAARFPGKLAHSFPLRAIALPRVTGRRETVVTKASPLAAYRAIGPDTAFTMLGDARGVLTMLKALVHQLPCYDLALGADEDGIREALHDVLNRH